MPLMESKVSHISKMRRSRQRGFTLLEIMVVIVILGLLASLTIPSLMGNKEKADRQKAASDIVALENALDMYKLDNGRYPSAEQGLAALVTRPALAPIEKLSRRRLYPPVAARSLGQEYRLRNPGRHGKLDVFSLGPDGIADTDDDIGNWVADADAP